MFLRNTAQSGAKARVEGFFSYVGSGIIIFMDKKREKEIVKAGLIGVLLNLLLVIGKGTVGFLAGSVSIILDAVNNLTDILSATVTIIGAKLAGRAPDKEHPFGHGRVEYLAAVFVGVIIFFAGVGALVEAVPKIFEPTLANYSLITISLLVVAILVKLGFGAYLKKKGGAIKSRSLEATGTDALYDSLLTFGTLVSAVVGILFKVSLEGIIGTIISVFIIRTSLEILGEGWIDIVGRRVDAKLAKKIKRKISLFPEVKGVYDLVLHSYGPMETIGSVHIQVPDKMTAKEIHKLTREIARKIFEDEQVILTIGIYAENKDSKEGRAVLKKLEEITKREAGILQTHGFYFDEEEKNVSFDMILDYSYREKEKLKNKVIRELREEFPGYRFNVIIDLDVSD